MPTRTVRGARLLRFGPFELDPRAAELRKHGVRIRLQEQPFRLLLLLLERPGEVVLRDELRKRLWPNDTVVEVGHGINAAILRLREALSESAENPRFIETVARRGYRFNGEVAVAFKDDSGPSLVSVVSLDARAAAPSSPAMPALDTDELTGRSISHFAVLEKLGGGGMGVVYRAQDLTLGRQVALKFLPRDLAADASALTRFQREARAASALNHPNVCTIYGVEECAGQPVIVMEMIEGETLAARLDRGPIPLKEALPLAIQVVAALDAAHRQSIVHRDLKPSNLLVTKTGVKVLDFGLAKIGRTVPEGARQENPASGLTRYGAVMGTPRYMSPEQVQGRETDARSDIFSFGLVLYEMLTGRPAMADDRTSSVLLSTWQPEALILPESAGPPALRRLLQRCLQMDPEERWQSARDLREALAWIDTSPLVHRRVPRWIYPALAAALFLALVIIAAEQLAERSRRASKQAITALSGAPLPGIESGRFSLSPDGRSLAYLASRNLIVRDVASGEIRQVASDVTAGTPFWSPDGRSLAIATGAMLQRYSLAGGLPAIVSGIHTSIAGAWGPDGSILIGQLGDGIYRIPASGGEPQRITEPNRSNGETRHLLPVFLPGGRQFLFVAGAGSDGGQLFAASLDSPRRTPILPVSSNVVYAASGADPRRGYLLYVKDRLLLAQPFDSDTLRLTGQPSILAGNLTSNSSAGAAVSIFDFSASRDTLVYRSSGSTLPGTIPASMAITAMPGRTKVTVVRDWMTRLR